MKQIKLYSKDIVRVCKYALVSMMFFMGVIPALAQDESEIAVEDAPTAQVKKIKKPVKNYPMKEVKGKVVDAATGEPLAGVQIKSYNNSFYTAMTNEEGVYTIKVPTFVTSLEATLQGYNKVRTAINDRSENVDIQLLTERYLPDYELVTRGSKKVGITDFETTTNMTIDDEIRDRLGADVRSISRSALNAQGSAMFINGLNSLNSNAQPLIVLDGVVYDMLYDSEMIHLGYFNNLLASINMDDIESVEVLKNGTAIYGAKAANGVILINTKRNKSMATRIDFNASVGVELLPKTMDVMNASEYRAYASQMLQSTATKLNEFKFLNTDPNYYYYNMYHNDTDWKDISYKEALTQNYSLHIQGGDDVANYNLSVGYTDAAATLRKNDMNRFNIRFNTDIVLNRWFSTRFDAMYTNITRNLRDAGMESKLNTSAIAATNTLALIKSPFVSPYDFSTDGKVSSFIADADDYLNEVLGSKASLANPKAILENAEAKNKNHVDMTQVGITIAPTWEPTKNFSITERFSYMLQSFDERYYSPLIGMPTYLLEGRGYVDNSNESIFSKHTAVFSDTQAKWAIPLGKHRLDLFGGVRFMNDTYNSSSMTGYSSQNDKMPNMSTALRYPENNGVDTNWRTLSYYANVSYNFKEKYYLDGQFSMETSSRFGKEVDAGLKLFGVAWGLFPSLQASWVITNEDWFKPTNGINFLKLNVGFESVGNDQVDNTATLTYLAGSTMFGEKFPTIKFSNIGNTTLCWETTNRLNAGIEGNFINNRLNVRVNYFKSWTNNLITLGSLSYVAGLTDYWTNDGKLQNEGFDAAFTAKLINQKNFKFELGASMGHYKNKVTQLPNGVKSFTTDMYNATILTSVGNPVGLFYGYKTDGVYATSAAAAKDGLAIQDIAGNKTYYGAGDMKFIDQNNDKIINDADRVIIGDPNPDIYGNIRANFLIGKHWSLGINFNYSLGNDIYNYQRALLESGSMFVNQTTAMNRRWMTEGQVTDMPSVVYGDPMGNSRFSDRWIEDGSYLKLKNVKLAYNVPIQNEYIQGLSVWVAANNLYTFTRYLGNDPEVTPGNGVLVQGIDAGYLNPGRNFTLGVKINL